MSIGPFGSIRPQLAAVRRPGQDSWLARTFAFLERLLHADFSACGDLYTYRAAIAVLLVPWFARRAVADLATAFAETSVLWTRFHNLSGRPGSRPSPGSSATA